MQKTSESVETFSLEQRFPLISETVRLWHQLPHKLAFGLAFAALVALFHRWGNPTFGYIKSSSLFAWMHYVFTTSVDDEHCLYVPLIVLALLVWKRAELLAIPKAPSWPALAIVAAGLALHIAGFVVQQTRVSIVAFALTVYGLTGVFWGWAWLKATFFPMVLLGFMVPLGTVADTLTFPLRIVVSKIAVGLSTSVLGIDVIRDGVQIFDSRRVYQYEVAAACSGIRSLTVLLMLAIIYAYASFSSMGKRLLIIASAVPLAIFGNVVRLTAVIVVAEAFGQDAGTFVEQKLGFVTFAAAIGLLFLLGNWLLGPKQPRAEAPSPQAA